MKRLTLDETWKNCLSMWRWIAKEKENENADGVWALKRQWIEENDLETHEVQNKCFFCEYDRENSGINPDRHTDSCPDCPGSIVDPSFDCYHPDYDFEADPIAFYNKLVSLNRKRLKK